MQHHVIFDNSGSIIEFQICLPPYKSNPICFSDPDIQAENLAEMKHHKLARARRTGQSEKDLKPNAETRNRLNDIISYPNTQTLSSEEKDLVWQYRFYLSANKKALAKFVKCVDWNTKTEANQALDLVSVYYSPIEINLKNITGGPSKLFHNYKSSSLNGQSIQQEAPISDQVHCVLGFGIGKPNTIR